MTGDLRGWAAWIPKYVAWCGAMVARQVLLPMKCTPIFVPMNIFRNSYLGYCKQILWPAFHNVSPACLLGMPSPLV